MKQHEAVIQVMEEKGGIATLGQLYQRVDVKDWKTKTPFATIRRIVQDKRYFFKIKPGLWALNSYRDKLSQYIPFDGSNKEKEVFSHSYYQGLLVELGNIKGFSTFIPNQDKNKQYLNNSLGDYASVKEIYKFTYDEVVNRARTIDVIWFNDQKFPQSFFEIEHSTDFQNSFLKMIDLRFFYAEFNIVADNKRYKEFEKKISNSIFDELKKRINFISYDKLADYHSKAYSYYEMNKEMKM